MIWCAVSGHGILGPYFVEDDSQNPLTVNQEGYREIIIAPFVRDLKLYVAPETCHCEDSGCSKMDLQDHTAGESLAYLQQHFGDHIITRGTEFSVPSHSSDLTAPDAYI